MKIIQSNPCYSKYYDMYVVKYYLADVDNATLLCDEISNDTDFMVMEMKKMNEKTTLITITHKTKIRFDRKDLTEINKYLYDYESKRKLSD